jgi:hypothetical protein
MVVARTPLSLGKRPAAAVSLATAEPSERQRLGEGQLLSRLCVESPPRALKLALERLGALAAVTIAPHSPQLQRAVSRTNLRGKG